MLFLKCDLCRYAPSFIAHYYRLVDHPAPDPETLGTLYRDVSCLTTVREEGGCFVFGWLMVCVFVCLFVCLFFFNMRSRWGLKATSVLLKARLWG